MRYAGRRGGRLKTSTIRRGMPRDANREEGLHAVDVATKLECSGDPEAAKKIKSQVLASPRLRELALYRVFGIFPCRDAVMKARKPALFDLVQEFFKNITSTGEIFISLGDYINKNWRPNLTFYDVLWEDEFKVDEDEPPKSGWLPCPYGWFQRWPWDVVKEEANTHGAEIVFGHASRTLWSKDVNLRCEIVLVEAEDAWEQLRQYPLLQIPSRREKFAGVDPATFPVKYDLIHTPERT